MFKTETSFYMDNWKLSDDTNAEYGKILVGILALLLYIIIFSSLVIGALDCSNVKMDLEFIVDFKTPNFI